MISSYFAKVIKSKCLAVPRIFEDYVLFVDLAAVLSLHYIFTYVLRFVMISDCKTLSPNGRSSMQNLLIDESEMESLDCNTGRTIFSSPSYTVSPTVEVFLKIKPKHVEKDLEVLAKDDSYQILDSGTLCTKFTPSNNPRSSRLPRLSSTVTKKFYFSKIFEPSISQAEFFEQTVKQRIVEFLAGRSTTVMTYGTTNSGKTYTLYGTPDQPGLIPRAIEYIFSAITCTLMPWYKLNDDNALTSLDDNERTQESDKKDKLLRSRLINKEKYTEARRSLENSERSNENEDCNGESMYAVWITFSEIYNENVYDLLDFEDSAKSRPLRLIGDKNGRTRVKGLTTVYATTAFEACQILMAGQSRMNTACTRMNPKSSRSHTIFTIGLLKYQKANVPRETEACTLTFCDLAGSGRSKKVGESRIRLVEARNINNSLLVLGRCLRTVYESQSTRRVGDRVSGPFRESKLTRIFQRALSGHEHVTFIVNIDPSTELINETQSILNVSAKVDKIISEEPKAKDTARSFKIDDEQILLVDSESSILLNNDEKDTQSTKRLIVKSKKSLLDQEESLKTALLKRELEVRKELADHYGSLIDRIDGSWKERTKEVEEEGKDLLKWSVDQIVSFYKERIDGIMSAKKRKRDEMSCDDEDEGECTFGEDWQDESVEETTKLCALKTAFGKLREEHRTVLVEKNSCSFELSLLKQKLKDFQDLARVELSKSSFNDDDFDLNSSAILLKRLIEEKDRNIRILEKDLEEIRNNSLKIKESETFGDRSFNTEDKMAEDAREIAKLKEELIDKSVDISKLTIKLESCEKELNQTEIACKDAELKNLELSEKIEALENIVRQMERKCRDSAMPRPPYYLEEVLIEKMDHRLDKDDQNLDCRLSSITDDSFFGDGIGEPGNLVVQAHIDIKKYNPEIRKIPSKRTSSNISDTESKSLFDSSGNDFRSSDASSRNDSGIVVGSKFETRFVDTRGESFEEKLIEYRDKLLFKEQEFERARKENLQIIEKYKEVSESLVAKSREYERETYELREKLRLAEERKDSIAGTLDTYIGKNTRLEYELSKTRDKMKETMAECKENHLPRLEKLEGDLSSRTKELKEANRNIAMADRDLTKLDDLTERLTKLTIIVQECQKERDDLNAQLRQSTEKQTALETKLKQFCISIEKKEEILSSLDCDTKMVYFENEFNSRQAKELYNKTMQVRGKMSLLENYLQRTEKSRQDMERKTERNIVDLRTELTGLEEQVTRLSRTLELFDDKENELIRAKNKLIEKERELSLCERNRDDMMKKYDFLEKRLQEELAKSRASSLTDKDLANPVVRTRSKFRVSESLKKFARVGKSGESNWKSTSFRKKSRDEKSLASTSVSSVSRLSSCRETRVNSMSDDRDRCDECDECVDCVDCERCDELDDEMASSQTESDIDSNESDSRGTSGSSARTQDDFDPRIVRSGFTRGCSMSGWMRIRRINARTVLPLCSDVENDGDRSDS